MDYDSLEDLASAKWLPSTWGEDYTPTKREKTILRFARQLNTMVNKYYKDKMGEA